MLGNKKEIEITQAFVSPVHGNVYIGKKITLPSKEADVLIAHGVAVEIGSEEHKKLLDAVPATSKPSTKPTPVTDPYKGMTAAQKKKAMAADKEAADKKAAEESVQAEIAEKQKRLEELTEKDGLTDDEADEADALEADLKALKGE